MEVSATAELTSVVAVGAVSLDLGSVVVTVDSVIAFVCGDCALDAPELDFEDTSAVVVDPASLDSVGLTDWEVSELFDGIMDWTVVGLVVSSLVRYSLTVLPSDVDLVSKVTGFEIELRLELVISSDGLEVSIVLPSLFGMVDVSELRLFGSLVIVLEANGDAVSSVVTDVELVVSCVGSVPDVVDAVEL